MKSGLRGLPLDQTQGRKHTGGEGQEFSNRNTHHSYTTSYLKGGKLKNPLGPVLEGARVQCLVLIVQPQSNKWHLT